MARAGTPTTQSGLWGGVELLDRGSVLVNRGGTTDILDRDLAEALLSQLGNISPKGLRSLLLELLPEIGVADMGDLDGADLAELLGGILG